MWPARKGSYSIQAYRQASSHWNLGKPRLHRDSDPDPDQDWLRLHGGELDSNPDSDHISHMDCDPDSNPDTPIL